MFHFLFTHLNDLILKSNQKNILVISKTNKYPVWMTNGLIVTEILVIIKNQKTKQTWKIVFFSSTSRITHFFVI